MGLGRRMARLDDHFAARWRQEAEAVTGRLEEWRLQHPQATSWTSTRPATQRPLTTRTRRS
jgi:hypothetical protein